MNLLLIEDDDRIARFLLRGLKEDGHSLTWHRDGEAGFEAALSQSFDAIILDLMLPKMDGRAICEKLRAAGVTSKILMLTALASTADLVKGFALGADDYLTKPFAFDELTARLQALSRRATPAPLRQTPILQAGDLQFDTASLIVTLAGTPLEMTSLEYALLEFLMLEQGKVVSRSRILQHVWGTTEDPLTNVVDVYIRRLRAHFATLGAADRIVTLRGRGYRLQTPPAARLPPANARSDPPPEPL